jgi:hypothetical protein
MKLLRRGRKILKWSRMLTVELILGRVVDVGNG